MIKRRILGGFLFFAPIVAFLFSIYKFAPEVGIVFLIILGSLILAVIVGFILKFGWDLMTQ